MAPPFSSWDTGRVVPDGVSTFHLSFTYLLDIMLLTDKILETGILTTGFISVVLLKDGTKGVFIHKFQC